MSCNVYLFHLSFYFACHRWWLGIGDNVSSCISGFYEIRQVLECKWVVAVLCCCLLLLWQSSHFPCQILSKITFCQFFYLQVHKTQVFEQSLFLFSFSLFCQRQKASFCLAGLDNSWFFFPRFFLAKMMPLFFFPFLVMIPIKTLGYNSLLLPFFSFFQRFFQCEMVA